MFQPRGKCLGGSSSINAMVYIRGNKLDYDEWGERNPGWSWSHMLPHFLSTEKQTRDVIQLNNNLLKYYFNNKFVSYRN